MTVYFAFLIHIYQPPVQLPSIVKQITEESYRPMIQSLKDFPLAKITLNINASLTEQLADYELTDVIQDLASLSNYGQVEFVGSAKYHALLPLIPDPEIERQIKLNAETNQHYFGRVYDPKGFFPPEMAIVTDIFDAIKRTGHEYFVMSAIGNPKPHFPTESFYQTENGLAVVFRDDMISNDISFDRLDGNSFFDRIKYRHTDQDYYVIIAQDGETYGHHIKHAFDKFWRPMLAQLEHRTDVKMVTIGELVEKFGKGEIISPKASSWSTDQGDIDYGNPFPLWLSPGNPMHGKQHQIILKTTKLVLNAENLKEPGESEHYWNVARSMLDRGAHSCQQWWASKRPWYSPDMILRGLNELMLAAVNARRAVPKRDDLYDMRQVFTEVLDEILELQRELILSLD